MITKMYWSLHNTLTASKALNGKGKQYYGEDGVVNDKRKDRDVERKTAVN